jgi:hypothetical protein
LEAALGAKASAKPEISSHDYDARVEFYERHGSGGGAEGYATLIARLRFDYELWNIPPGLERDNLLLHLVTKVLPCAKMYLKRTQQGFADIQMHRDALKKLSNLFIQISNIPAESYILPAVEQADKREGPATLEKLNKLTEEAIEAKDNSDVMWVKKYARIRALLYAKKMRGAY